MSSIRVNPFALPDLLAALGNTRQQADTASLELATGSRINQPSDDPGGAAQLISNHDQSSQADSFLRSISSVNGLLQTADSTLGSVVTVLQRAISLGVEGANGTLSASDRADHRHRTDRHSAAAHQPGERFVPGGVHLFGNLYGAAVRR